MHTTVEQPVSRPADARGRCRNARVGANRPLLALVALLLSTLVDVAASADPGGDPRGPAALQLAQSRPPPADCPGPYMRPDGLGRCVFMCGGNGTVPDAATQECVCKPGLTETGTDEIGRRICGLSLAPLPAQPEAQNPQWVQVTSFQIDGGAQQTGGIDVTLSVGVQTSPNLQGAALQYRAAEGPYYQDQAFQRQLLAAAPWQNFPTRMLAAGFRLSGGAGTKHVYLQVRAAAPGGAWVESAPKVAAITLLAAQVQGAPAGEAFQLATVNGFQFTAESSGAHACFLQQDGAFLRLVARDDPSTRPPGVLPPPGGCVFRLFVGRALAPGWSFSGRADIEPGVCASGQTIVDAPTLQGLVVQIALIDWTFSRPGRDCLLRGWTLRSFGLSGPAGADWRDAFR